MAEIPLDQRERNELCDLLLQLGPDAPTLCEGWTTADLAAHLAIRERDPRSGPGILFGDSAFGRYTAKLQNRQKAKGFAETVDRVRSGPPWFPWRIKKLRLLINLNEYFVHHEDVRRANGMTRRTDRPDLDDALWSIVSRAGAMSARKLKPFGLEVRRPEGAAVVLRNAEKVAVLTGHPSEIALYLFGRRGAADVQISGDAEATAKLRQAQLGI
ncbi:MAG: TIGR03085 family metal-binding protein [Acidimicrobiia bacterium]